MQNSLPINPQLRVHCRRQHNLLCESLSRNNAVVVAKFAVIAFGGVRVLGQLHCSWEKG
jgi:hypothetical protein